MTASFREFTDAGAEAYERWFVPVIGAPVSSGLLEAADLQPGERVVDVACGTGVIARAAAERVGPTGAVDAVDVAPDMIDVARGLPTSGAPVEWHVADAAALPLADGGHDVALCQMSLMFMPDRVAAVAEMRRVLADGGRVLVNAPGPIQPALEVMEQAIVEHIDPDLGGFVRAVFSMHDPDAVGAVLRDAGCRDVRATQYAATLRLPGPAEFLWQYINATPLGPFVAQAPEPAKAAMERAMVEGSAHLVVDGRLPVDQPMALATGRR